MEAVTPRLTSKSIGCCKKFPGKNAITGLASLEYWLHELAKEICERLDQDELENNRRPKQLVVSYMQAINNNDVSSSRSLNLIIIDEDRIVNDAVDAIKRNTEKFLKTEELLNNPIKFLGLSVGKFELHDLKRNNTIQDMFKKTIDIQTKTDEKKDSDSTVTEETRAESQSDDKREVLVTRKNGTIQDLFKKSAAAAATKEEQSENPSTLENVEDSTIQEPAKPASSEQSFFAKFKITNHTTATEKVQDDSSTFAEPALEESNHEDDDINSFQNEELLEEIAENEQVLSGMRAPSPVASTSKAADYKQTYAEFYRPPSNLDIPKEKCSQCNKMVNVHEMQVHNDEHFAFHLTQEQRVEYQSKLQTATVAVTAPPAKKMKTSKPAATVSTTFSIDKFLVKKDAAQHNESVAGCSSAVEVETERCSECGKNIPITEILEHMDYHAAKKLHEELLRSEMANKRTPASDTKPKTDSTKGSKGKKMTKNNSNKSNNSSGKSIVAFFQNA